TTPILMSPLLPVRTSEDGRCGLAIRACVDAVLVDRDEVLASPDGEQPGLGRRLDAPGRCGVGRQRAEALLLEARADLVLAHVERLRLLEWNVDLLLDLL